MRLMIDRQSTQTPAPTISTADGRRPGLAKKDSVVHFDAAGAQHAATKPLYDGTLTR
jgi:hypothetical protein